MEILLILSLLIVRTYAATKCMDAGIGPCIPYFPGIHSCPDGSACLVDPTNDTASICCSFAMLDTGNCYSVVTSASPTAPSTAPPGCYDRLNPQTGKSDCPQLKYLCDDPGYFDLMTQQCPLTCNRCSGTVATTPSCVDKVNPATGVSDCPSQKPLCTNPPYEPLMREQCPKTYLLVPVGPTPLNGRESSLSYSSTSMESMRGTADYQPLQFLNLGNQITTSF